MYYTLFIDESGDFESRKFQKDLLRILKEVE